MFVRKDITDVNPNEILHGMANDRILTSARELIKGDENDIHPWDIDIFDPVSNVDDTTIKDDKKVVDVDDVWGDDIFHGDNVQW